MTAASAVGILAACVVCMAVLKDASWLRFFRLGRGNNRLVLHSSQRSTITILLDRGETFRGGLRADEMMLFSAALLANAARGASVGLFFDTTDNAGVGATSNDAGKIVTMSDSWAYFAQDGTTRIESTQASIDINISSWNNSSSLWKAQTLIHELGHVFNILLGAGGSDFVQDANKDGSPNAAAEATNLKIVQDCIH
jgi:hypothetical protein